MRHAPAPANQCSDQHRDAHGNSAEVTNCEQRERKREIVAAHCAAPSDPKRLRNVRREANEQLKKLLKDKQCSEDEERRAHDELQKMTDRFVAEIDKLMQVKETDLMAI